MLSTRRSSKASSIASDGSGAAQSLGQLKRSNDALQAEVGMLRRQKRLMEEALDKERAMHADKVSDLFAQIAHRQENVEQAVLPARVLQQDVNLGEQVLQADVHELEASLCHAKREVAALQQKLAQSENNRRKEIESVKSTSQFHLSELQKEMDRMREEGRKSSGGAEDPAPQQMMVDLLGQELKSAQARVDEVMNRYLCAMREIDDLQEQNVDCNVRIVELKEALAECAAHCSEVQKTNNSASAGAQNGKISAIHTKLQDLLKCKDDTSDTDCLADDSDAEEIGVADGVVSALRNRVRVLKDELRRVRSLREQENAVSVACQREAKRHMNELVVESEELRAQIVLMQDGQERLTESRHDTCAFEKMLKDREGCINIVMNQLEEAWAENEAARRELGNIPAELDALCMQDEQKDSIIAGLQAAINDAERTIVSLQDGQDNSSRLREELMCRKQDVRFMRRGLRDFTREVEWCAQERSRLRRALRRMEGNYRDVVEDNKLLRCELDAHRARARNSAYIGMSRPSEASSPIWSIERGSTTLPNTNMVREVRTAEEAPYLLSTRGPALTAASPTAQQPVSEPLSQTRRSVSQKAAAAPPPEVPVDVSRVSGSNSAGACVSIFTPSLNMADLPPSTFQSPGMQPGAAVSAGLNMMPWDLEQQGQRSGRAAIPAGAHVLLTLHEVSCVMHNGEAITEAGVIFIKIKSKKEKYMTSVMELAPIVRFDESFAFYLAHPEEEFLKVYVFYKSMRSHREVFVGKTFLCLRELYRGVPHRRALPIVQNAATCSARRAGQIEVTLQTDDYGSPLPLANYDAAQEKSRFDRFVLRLESDEPEKLHMADMHR